MNRLLTKLRTRLDRLLHPEPPPVHRDLSALAVVDIATAANAIDRSIHTTQTYHEDASYRLGVSQRSTRTTTLFESYRYDRVEPILIDARECEAAVRERMAKAETSYRVGAAAVEATIDEAVLYSNVVYEIDDGRLTAIYESCRPEDRRALKTIPHERLARVRVLPDGHDYVFLGSPGSANYGHWLTDDLTRLPVRGPEDPVTTTYLVPLSDALGDARRLELLAIALHGERYRVVGVERYKPVLVPRLRYTSRATYHPYLMSPQAIARLRERFASALAPRTAPRRPTGLVYLARRAPVRRHVVNADALEALLVTRGFTIVDPVEADARTQVSACLDARVVIGVMGAAMSNTLFAPPGSTVIHLVPRGWTEPYFWDLASVCGHRYIAVFCDCVGDAGSAGPVEEQSVVADLDAIEEALQSAL